MKVHMFFLRRKPTHSVLGEQLKTTDFAYLCGCILVQVYCLLLHGVGGLLSDFIFLPLLLTSITCSLGVIWTWFLIYSLYLKND